MKHFGGYLPCFLNVAACVADTASRPQVGWHIPEENMGEVAAMYCPIGDGSSIERMTEACPSHFISVHHALSSTAQQFSRGAQAVLFKLPTV